MFINWRLVMVWALCSSLGVGGFVVLTDAKAWERPPGWAQRDALASVQFAHDPNRACAKAGVNTRVAGCGGRGWMILPNPCVWPSRAGDYADLACHELGRSWAWTAR